LLATLAAPLIYSLST